MSAMEPPNQLVQEFREGLARGEILIRVCNSCRRPHMYPRYYCPFCQSDELGWVQSKGAGVLHSHTVVRAVAPRGFEAELPYALGVVKLDEGVQLLGRLLADVDGEWTAYACDARVQSVRRTPQELEGRAVAWFRLSAGASPSDR